METSVEIILKITIQIGHKTPMRLCFALVMVSPRGSSATEMRRHSGRGSERRARLWMGVSGMKVTGPCSGQSEVYERSHSVHPAQKVVWVKRL